MTPNPIYVIEFKPECGGTRLYKDTTSASFDEAVSTFEKQQYEFVKNGMNGPGEITRAWMYTPVLMIDRTTNERNEDHT
jgi:hypothetical protein